jgi:hypothetical protein
MHELHELKELKELEVQKNLQRPHLQKRGSRSSEKVWDLRRCRLQVVRPSHSFPSPQLLSFKPYTQPEDVTVTSSTLIYGSLNSSENEDGAKRRWQMGTRI